MIPKSWRDIPSNPVFLKHELFIICGIYKQTICWFLAYIFSCLPSLVAQLVKNPPAVQETLVRFLGREDPLEEGWATIPVFLGFPGGSDGRESTCNVGVLGLIPGF